MKHAQNVPNTGNPEGIVTSRGTKTPKRSVWKGRFRRRRVAMTIVVLVVGVFSVADRTGWLTAHQPARPRLRDDYARYHDRVFTVTRVVDGDTVDLDVADGDSAVTRVRLWGVDTPEIASVRHGPMHFGNQAAAFTKSLVEAKAVRIRLTDRHHTRGRYGRLLAYVIVAETGTSLNEALLRSGHAYADPRFAHPLLDRYRQLEAEAEQARVGLWKNVTPAQYPHWKKR